MVKGTPVLLQLLSFLTGDHWEVKFRAAEDAKVPGRQPPIPQTLCAFFQAVWIHLSGLLTF